MMHVEGDGGRRHWSVFGSANFDNRSLELNDEITVAVARRRCWPRGCTTRSKRDLSAIDALDARRVARAAVALKVRERFWGLFGELF